MKKVYFLILFILAGYAVHGQVTLNSSYNPAIGDSFRQILCDTTGVVPGNSGANVTWNFTSLQPADTQSYQWVNPASTPYGSQFTTSNVASSDGSSYNYFTAGSSSLLFNGVGSSSLVISYSNPQTIFNYPFIYGSTHTDNFAAVFQYTGNTTYRTGSATTTGDAWGTVNTPFGTFSNALRVKIVNNIKDSARVGIINVIVLTNQQIYQWYVPGRKFPVLEINYMTMITPIGTTNSKTVYFNSNSLQIGIEPIGNIVPEKFRLEQNYPNPFNPVTKIKFSIPKSTFLQIDIIDEKGSVVYNEYYDNINAGEYEFTFKPENISSGVYYYRFTSGDQTITKKMVFIK
jgi:hypothetical protein